MCSYNSLYHVTEHMKNLTRSQISPIHNAANYGEPTDITVQTYLILVVIAWWKDMPIINLNTLRISIIHFGLFQLCEMCCLLACFVAPVFRRLLKPTTQTYSMTLIIQSQLQMHSHDPSVRIMHLYKQYGWVTPRLKIPQLILFDDQQNLLNYATYNRNTEAVSPYARPGRLWAGWKVRIIQGVIMMRGAIAS